MLHSEVIVESKGLIFWVLIVSSSAEVSKSVPRADKVFQWKLFWDELQEHWLYFYKWRISKDIEKTMQNDNQFIKIIFYWLCSPATILIKSASDF